MNAQTETRPQHRNVFSALAAAQLEFGQVTKGAVNPAFKSKYADLADVAAVVIPTLARHGVAVVHYIVPGERDYMRTEFVHGDTETKVSCDVPLIVDRQNMQGMKSATTYAKRIGLESLSGVAPEDDDGNAAAKAPPREEQMRRDNAVTMALSYLEEAPTLEDLAAHWKNLPNAIKSDPRCIAEKERAKERLQKKPAAELVADEIPY